jgi:hypothetical protein
VGQSDQHRTINGQVTSGDTKRQPVGASTT